MEGPGSLAVRCEEPGTDFYVTSYKNYGPGAAIREMTVHFWTILCFLL